MRKVIGVGVGIGVVVVVGWLVLRDRAGTDRGARARPADRSNMRDAVAAAGRADRDSVAGASGRANRGAVAPGGGAAAAGLAPSIADDDKPRSRMDYGAAWSTLPPAYTVDALGHGVAVNLQGGSAQITRHGGRAADPSALVDVGGRVREGGAAAPGVLVVVADRFRVQFGHLSADASATTDADGRFALRAPPGARVAVALGPRGWSALTRIEPGRDVDLELLPAAALEVTVVEDGVALDASLSLRAADGVLAGTVTAADGVFHFAALPPGMFMIGAQATHEHASGGDQVTLVTLDVRAGQLTRHRIELDSMNATVAVRTALRVEEQPRTVELALLPVPPPTTLAELRARAPRMPLLGGRDAANTYQFHRVTPAGPRVACVLVHLAASDDEPAAPGVRWGCAAVDVPADGVVEVEVPATSPPD